jgi:hypothetical protein
MRCAAPPPVVGTSPGWPVSVPASPDRGAAFGTLVEVGIEEGSPTDVPQSPQNRLPSGTSLEQEGQRSLACTISKDLRSGGPWEGARGEP